MQGDLTMLFIEITCQALESSTNRGPDLCERYPALWLVLQDEYQPLLQ